MVLVRDVSWRNPFSPGSLPWLARLYRAGYARRGGADILRRIARKGARSLFAPIYRAGLGGAGRHGSFRLRVGESERTLRFRARNLQFHSIYLPQYANGSEPATAALFDVLVGDDGVFFDVGSNWGYYSLYVASRPGFRGHVHAFEPMPPTFADLESAVREAGLTDRVSCHPLALSDHDGESGMVLPDGLHSGNATVAAAGAAASRVRLRRLDDLGLPLPDVMKIDVEDHEQPMLAGAAGALAQSRPMIVMESWMHAERPGVTLGALSLLRDLGYTFFQPGWWRVVGGTGFADVSDAAPSRDFKTLALVPFEMEQRFSLEVMFNVLACHVDRLPDLRRLFAPAPSTGPRGAPTSAETEST